MYKNAITDSRIVSYPATPPDPGQAGSIIIDPFCGNRLLRVTDENTKDGAGFTTPSSTLVNPWNADQSVLWVKQRNGGLWFYDFDGDDFQATPRYFQGGMAVGFFSRQDPDLLWTFGDKLTFDAYNVETKARSVVVDCYDYPELGIPDSPRWYLNGLSVSWDDQRLAAMLGPGQDNSEVIVVWDERLGLAWLNTATGEFGGWGTSGVIPEFEPFVIHYVGLTPGGGTAYIGPSTAGGAPQRTVLWVPGTAMLTIYCPGEGMPFWGHPAQGFQMHFGLENGGPFAYAFCPLWNPSLSERLIKQTIEYPDGFWVGHHMSYQPDHADRNPVMLTTTNEAAPLSALAPGADEIMALSATGTGEWWRLAHHYATGKGGFYTSPRGNVSGDGRYYCFTSDWCATLGGAVPEQRSDVFVLETTREP